MSPARPPEPPERTGGTAQPRDRRPARPAGDPLDDGSLPLYTIGQVASLLGMQPAALRRLDEQDIVRPDRSEGGQRRYSRDEVDRLREVLELTDQGVTLAGVREVLALRQRVSDLEDELAQMREDAAPRDDRPEDA